jgi:hypothetical protein
VIIRKRVATSSSTFGGTVAGNGFGQLQVTGEAALSGNLDIRLVDGFRPDVGDQSRIFTFGSRDQDFGSINGLDLGGGLRFDPVYDANGLTLVTTGPTAPPGMSPAVESGGHALAPAWAGVQPDDPDAWFRLVGAADTLAAEALLALI